MRYGALRRQVGAGTLSKPQMEHVTLRQARPSDASFLLSLAREAYSEVLSLQFAGWDETVHGARFAEKVATLPFFVAELEGEPMGTVSSSIHADHVRVNELVVLPAFQNRGLGSFLLLRARTGSQHRLAR